MGEFNEKNRGKIEHEWNSGLICFDLPGVYSYLRRLIHILFTVEQHSNYWVAVGKGWINPVFTLPPVGGASFIKQVESGNGQADGDGKS